MNKEQSIGACPKRTSMSIPANVSKMMKRWGYKEGRGLGRYGHGIINPIKAYKRPMNQGLGFKEKTYDSNDCFVFQPATEMTKAELEDKLTLMLNSTYAAMKELIHRYSILKDGSLQSYKDNKHANTARCVVFLLMEGLLQHMDPLHDPCQLLDLVSHLKYILDDDGSATSEYAKLVNDLVATVLEKESQTFAAQDLDQEDVIRFLKTWCDALPGLPAIENFLDEVLMPQLSVHLNTYDAWNDVPLHKSVLQWIPVLGSRVEPLYAHVLTTLDWILQESDGVKASAVFNELIPWKDALKPNAWSELVSGHVLPYLRKRLQKLHDPNDWSDMNLRSQEDVERNRFAGLMMWGTEVQPGVMVTQFEEEISGEWKALLCHWLPSAGPTMVCQWKEEFGMNAWNEFVNSHVLPSLNKDLKALHGTPPYAEDTAFDGLMRWATVLPPREMLTCFDKEYPGKWQAQLCRWLCSVEINVVQQWKQAFESKSWEEFVSRAEEFLDRGLQTLEIIPAQESDYEGFTGMMRLATVILPHHTNELLMKRFFDYWHGGLYLWLFNEKPPLDEATSWLNGWKRVFTRELLPNEYVSDSVVIDHVKRGLQVIIEVLCLKE